MDVLWFITFTLNENFIYNEKEKYSFNSYIIIKFNDIFKLFYF